MYWVLGRVGDLIYFYWILWQNMYPFLQWQQPNLYASHWFSKQEKSKIKQNKSGFTIFFKKELWMVITMLQWGGGGGELINTTMWLYIVFCSLSTWEQSSLWIFPLPGQTECHSTILSWLWILLL